MRQRNVPSCSSDRGFTLIEVMVAAAVLMVGVLGTFVMLDGANGMSRENNARTSTTSLAREVLESARALQYEDLTDTGLVAALRARDSIKGSLSADGRWVIMRRRVPIVVTTKVCTFDDPMDGLGTAAPNNPACPAAAAVNARVDSNADDFRRVTVTLEWLRDAGGALPDASAPCNSGRKLCVVQTTQVNNPGGGLGPRITNFPDPHALQVTDPTKTQITFRATSTFANTVRWTVDDGVSAGDAATDTAGTSGPGYDWLFNWNIGTPKALNDGTWTLDGVYTANAQPFDARAIPGEMRVASVSLNRRVPIRPRTFRGGRSRIATAGGDVDVVELDWVASPERDVLGYRVYLVTNPSGVRTLTRVCPAPTEGDHAVITENACTDRNPLGHVTGTTVRYEVVAVDRETIAVSTSNTRDGSPSIIDIGAMSSTQFQAPQITLAEVSATEGKPRLVWDLPQNATSTYTPAFYRIYRDGVRIGRTADGTREWVDSDFGATTRHRYQVSAVDTGYREGTLSAEAETPG